MKIAVTGSIGSGKSTFVKELLAWLPEYRHFDFDAAVHALYTKPEFCTFLQGLFGSSDRKLVSDQVFVDPEKKRRLELESEDWLYPQLESALRQPNVVVEFPLLFETGWCLAQFDLIITVACSTETQVARVKARNGFSDEKIVAIQAAQCSAEVKTSLADVVINSESSLEEMRNQTRKLTQLVRHGDLKQRFEREFGSPEMWATLEAAYTAPGRRYHTLDHLAALFVHYDRLSPALRHPRAVRWAIWFHDYVYETRTKLYGHNEERSAQALFRLMRQYCPAKLGYSEEGQSCLALAAEMILATKEHLPNSRFFQSRPTALEDCRVFLDIDLSVLAQGQEEVQAYDQAIRAEFADVPAEEYVIGRTRALSAFLSRGQIFYSPWFAKAEAQARNNLQGLVQAHHRLEEKASTTPA